VKGRGLDWVNPKADRSGGEGKRTGFPPGGSPFPFPLARGTLRRSAHASGGAIVQARFRACSFPFHGLAARACGGTGRDGMTWGAPEDHRGHHQGQKRTRTGSRCRARAHHAAERGRRTQPTSRSQGPRGQARADGDGSWEWTVPISGLGRTRWVDRAVIRHVRGSTPIVGKAGGGDDDGDWHGHPHAQGQSRKRPGTLY